MDYKLIRQAYAELGELRLCLDGAERHRADLRRRIAISESRIKALEWMAAHQPIA